MEMYIHNDIECIQNRANLVLHQIMRTCDRTQIVENILPIKLYANGSTLTAAPEILHSEGKTIGAEAEHLCLNV